MVRVKGGRLSRRLIVVVVLLLGLGSGLTTTDGGRRSVAEAAGGVALNPAAGQFLALPGTVVLDSRTGAGVSAPNLTPGSTSTIPVTAVDGNPTGVPGDASAVVLEFHTSANFAGVLSAGPAAGSTDTSLTFPAGVERNGFDIVTPAPDGTVAVAITGFSPVPAGAALGKLVVRLHGYFTGEATTTAGATYVGYDPAPLANSSASESGFTLGGAPTSGPLAVGGATPYLAQVAGNAGVPADGSATAVAVQAIVTDPTCSGGLALVPAGSGRTDYTGAFTTGTNSEAFDLVALPPSGQLALRLLGCTGTANVVLRVRGYFSAPTSPTPGGSYAPARAKVFDTTTGTGTANCPATGDSPKLAPHSGCAVQVLGAGGFPGVGVSGIAAQVVAVNPGHDGWLGLYRDDTVAHTATLWYGPTGRTSNFEVASYTGLNPDGTVYLWNGGDYPVDVVVRAHGYYTAPQAPDQPGDVTATHTADGLQVAWTDPLGDGGAAVTGYDIGDGGSTAPTHVGPAARSVTIPDPGADAVVLVTAVNGVGAGEPLAPEGDAPDLVPSADIVFPSGASEAAITDQLSGYFGDRWSGTWTNGDGKLVAGATGLTQDDRDRVAEDLGVDAAQVVLAGTHYSETELQDYMDQLVALAIASPDAPKLTGFETNPKLDAVTITRSGLTPDFDRKLAAQTAVPSAAIASNSPAGDSGGGGGADVAGTFSPVGETYESYPPHKGGKRVRDLYYPYHCTTGFTMFDWVDYKLAGVSAGHCGRTGDTMHTCYNNKCTIGLIYANGHNFKGLQWGDWLLYDVDWSAESNLIYIKSNWQRHIDEMAHENLRLGEVVCKRGVASRTTCGTVTTGTRAFWVTENGKQVYYQHLQCGKVSADWGDSGGPVYQPKSNAARPTARAVGVSSGVLVDRYGRHLLFCWTPVWVVAAQSHALVLDW